MTVRGGHLRTPHVITNMFSSLAFSPSLSFYALLLNHICCSMVFFCFVAIRNRVERTRCTVLPAHYSPGLLLVLLQIIVP